MARPQTFVSHWHHYTEEFNTSALEFYAAVRKELEALEAPVTFDSVEWSEGSLLSAKRAYLRVEYNRFTFDICAAPFGKNFFFSWWLAKRPASFMVGCLGILALPFVWGICVALAGIIKGTFLAFVLIGVGLFFLGQSIRSGASEAGEMIAAIPYIGPVFDRFIRPVTYYSIDSRLMFEETVHETVLKVVDGLLAAKGAKALTADARKPTGDNLR